MGAINNAFNQVAGTVAGAALAVKHAKETDFAKMNSADSTAIVARSQARAANDEATAAVDEARLQGGLYQQMAEAEQKAEKADKAYNKAVKRKNGSYKTRLEKFTELEAANKAVHELNNKYQAIQSMKKRAEEQIDYANKATELAIQAKQKYQSRWGGK